MYHLTADSEVVFFSPFYVAWAADILGVGDGVGRRYSVDFNLGWGDIEIPVGFWGLTGICWVWGKCGTAFS